jgi:hypothetical protein
MGFASAVVGAEPDAAAAARNPSIPIAPAAGFLSDEMEVFLAFPLRAPMIKSDASPVSFFDLPR